MNKMKNYTLPEIMSQEAEKEFSLRDILTKKLRRITMDYKRIGRDSAYMITGAFFIIVFMIIPYCIFSYHQFKGNGLAITFYLVIMITYCISMGLWLSTIEKLDILNIKDIPMILVYIIFAPVVSGEILYTVIDNIEWIKEVELYKRHRH